MTYTGTPTVANVPDSTVGFRLDNALNGGTIFMTHGFATALDLKLALSRINF